MSLIPTSSHSSSCTHLGEGVCRLAENAKNAVQTCAGLPLILGGGLISIPIGYWLIGKVHDLHERRDFNAKRRKRQQERREQLDQLEKKFFLTKESIKIIELPFEELQRKLAAREFSATQVLEAFVAKAVAATRDFNCVTEFLPQAWEWAAELDQMPEVKGPFHGLPVCIKENQDIVGTDSTLGLSFLLYKPAQKHDPLVQQLLDGGAVPFCKTNVPQTVYSCASSNPIYGQTSNPLNKKLSPGGSTSGSACLVGAGGAAFGTGTDLGGSLRLPAHFCGICTLKPTLGRIVSKTVSQRTVTMAGVTGAYGILTQRAQTLASVYKILIGDSPALKYDPLIVPIPWNEEVFSSKSSLKIGYFTSVPYFPALGDTPATVLAAKNALEKMGHVLIPFELPDNDLLREIYLTLVYADGRFGIHSRLINDEVSDSGQKFFRGKTLLSPFWEFLRILEGRKSMKQSFGDPDGVKSRVLWTFLEKQKRIKYDILARMAKHNLDLLLSPVFPFPASRLEDTETLIDAFIYTSPWNMCDLPAGVVPFGKESCQNVAGYNDQGNFYMKLAKEGIKQAKNMPIGVQIIGKPFNEEMILRILTQLDEYKLQESKEC